MSEVESRKINAVTGFPETESGEARTHLLLCFPCLFSFCALTKMTHAALLWAGPQAWHPVGYMDSGTHSSFLQRSHFRLTNNADPTIRNLLTKVSTPKKRELPAKEDHSYKSCQELQNLGPVWHPSCRSHSPALRLGMLCWGGGSPD